MNGRKGLRCVYNNIASYVTLRNRFLISEASEVLSEESEKSGANAYGCCLRSTGAYYLLGYGLNAGNVKGIF